MLTKETAPQQYNVGDVVRVIGQKDFDCKDPLTGCYFNGGMSEYIGREFLITTKEWSPLHNYWFYKLEKCYGWIWVDPWLELVEDKIDISFSDEEFACLL